MLDELRKNSNSDKEFVQNELRKRIAELEKQIEELRNQFAVERDQMLNA
jgi:tRNA(Ile)-lysidine synthase TilS/MesJ